MRYDLAIRRIVVGAILATGLTGCATLSALDNVSSALDVYELRAPASLAPDGGRTLPLEVIIEEPTTTGVLQTDRIMIRPDRLRAQYLPGVRWSEPTPIMVQTLMQRSLEATGAIRYVSRRPLGISGDIAILTELVDFQAEQAPESDTATVELRLIARVVRESDVRILGTRTFVARVAVASLDTEDVIAAFDTAATQLFADHATWVVGILR
jgi:cholesterol transport system auxiliary component